MISEGILWFLCDKCRRKVSNCRHKQCEIIPGKPQNSTFNGIQKYCSDNREKYRPCKVNGSNLNGDWTAWSEWNCDDCFKKEKLAKRSRKCFGFFEGYFCITDKRGVSDFELMDCDEVCYKGEITFHFSSYSHHLRRLVFMIFSLE
jgi:hypothetical protein